MTCATWAPCRASACQVCENFNLKLKHRVWGVRVVPLRMWGQCRVPTSLLECTGGWVFHEPCFALKLYMRLLSSQSKLPQLFKYAPCVCQPLPFRSGG